MIETQDTPTALRAEQDFSLLGTSLCYAWDMSMPLAGNTGLLREDICVPEGPPFFFFHREPFKWGKYVYSGLKLVLDRDCAVEYTALLGTIFVKCCYSRHILAPIFFHMRVRWALLSKEFWSSSHL